MNQNVRTRFAPSPSGFLHVGGARTALFNYLYAKATGGKFLVRIEDTDQDRSTDSSMKIILESLEWLGLNWDEGPGVGGPHGPYKQSERLNIYKEYTERLIQNNHAYRCFCTTELLESKKKQSEAMGIPNIYDGTCSSMTEKEIQEKLDQKIPFSVRFRTPAKNLIVDDIIQGKVKFDTKLIGDFIIVKSDGFPAYNYAVVVDDHLMEITHVIRGVGHLSNTPRQILIYEAFGFPLPKYAHASEIVGADGKKLSKRAGATSILAFRDLGYTAECFRNYMALLGWTSESGQEYLPKGELEKLFDVERCSKSPSLFDVFKKVKEEDKEKLDFNSLPLSALADQLNPKSKLNWLSNKYIRDSDIVKLSGEILPFIKDNNSIPDDIKQAENKTLQSILESIRVYLDRLSQAPDYISEFFNNDIVIENEEARTIATSGNADKVIQTFFKLLGNGEPKSSDEYKALIDKTGIETGEKGKNLYMPIRVATTGKAHGLELPVLFNLLGTEKLKYRIKVISKEIGLSVS
ncbi:MAG TPA: glutamate--tRNA ligase [Leptospiraceae bacterium]|nr:glutamate--tRNA ligase [Leptospiraceae bacterium]HMW07716.1 glutamate--tRNA ligase [Leptospiraceae bacterium]HMX32014.1 glutamate--tRNA ligase [Leptospiraceae bacterium]HMY33382.1 glutamate--tRNA ligase [Leptospiraceae bacterium]HMZ67143.1 glutamate--tRNA ligase [Leptospiraceae bacterium]